jgi:hypothetical protein
MTGWPVGSGTRVLWVGAISLFAASALAQNASTQAPTSSPKSVETVIVTGRKPAADIDAVVSHFVASHATPNRKTGQYMRLDLGPVCPVTNGLPPAFDKFVTTRVLAVATSVGAKTDASGKCTPNVEILFTDRPAALIGALAEKTRGEILGVHYAHERASLLEVTHPIQGWYVTGTRYDDYSTDTAMSFGVDDTARDTYDRGEVLDDAYYRAPEQMVLNSHIPMRRISSIAHVLILADITKVGGREIGPVSDYIAMLALSQPPSLDDCNELPSILDLMSSTCGTRPKPQALTASDIAYLKALYATDLGATTISAQTKNIDDAMKNNLDDHGPE